MKQHSTTLILTALAAISCVHEREPPLPAAPLPAQPVVVAEPAAPPVEPLPNGGAVDSHFAALLDSGELIVGNRVALEAWRPDGTGQRTISAGSALHPRRFGHDHVVALRSASGSDLRDGAVVELITLADGKRRELAQLPAFRCAEQADSTLPKPERLSVWEASDFVVDSNRGVACLGIMDKAANGASVRVRARIDLAAARVGRWLALGDETCPAPEGVTVGDPSSDGVCWRVADVARAQPNPTSFPFIFDNEHVRVYAAPRGGSKTQVRGYEIDTTSPSDRWLLLAGDFTERESTYRRLLLLDRSQGKLFPIVDRAGTWPAPLKAAGAKLPTPVKQAELVSSTTDVRWLGASEKDEALVLDKLVIRPEHPAFEITEGELAR
jgi:hypothetical protein